MSTRHCGDHSIRHYTLNNMGVKGTNPSTVKNPSTTSDSPKT